MSDLGKTDPVFSHFSDTHTHEPETGPLTTAFCNAVQSDKVQNDPTQLLPSCLAVYTVNTAPGGFSELGNPKTLFLEGADLK